ncbi:MAG: alpha/beta hydrolase [Caulobacter sp.]|nr:alpha/beta hydrolase [Caulobacter sp.]
MADFASTVIHTDDRVRLMADVGGDPARPTVVLSHGRGQTRRAWGGAMRGLVRRGYHVISFDARGHGDSGWAPDADYSIQTRANDLLAVLATCGRPVALVGASMGGMAGYYAMGRAESPIADALVVVDIVPRVTAEGASQIKAFMHAAPDGFASLEEAADAVAAYIPGRPRPADVSGLKRNLRLGDNGRYQWHWDPRWLEQPSRTEADIQEMLAMGDRITVPTLLVRGLRSNLVDEAGVAEFRAHVPRLEVFDVPGAGHMVAGDRNDAFNAALFGFLGKHLPPVA